MIYQEEEQTISEQVFDSLQGFFSEEYQLDWVPFIFQPGMPLHQAYAQMRAAYNRLLERLEEVDEDRDVENIIDCMMDYCQIIGMEMFECGRKYQQMEDGKE